MSDIIEAVLAERQKQDAKWGVQNHGPDGWLAILTEEVGEVARAILEGSGLKYYDELVQVAAVAIAALECAERGNLEIGSLVKLQKELEAIKHRAKETCEWTRYWLNEAERIVAWRAGCHGRGFGTQYRFCPDCGRRIAEVKG